MNGSRQARAWGLGGLARRVAWGVALAALSAPAAAARPRVPPASTVPPVDTRASAAAQDKLLEARTRRGRAQAELNAAITRARRQFERSAEWQAAQARLSAARAALESARARVIGGLSQDPEYRSLKDRQRRLDEHLRGEQAPSSGAGPTPASEAHVRAEAGEKLASGSRAGRMEAAALAADPAAAAARQELTDAGAAVSRLRATFEESVRSDPSVVAARAAADAAGAAMDSAGAELASALDKEAQLEAQRQDKIRQLERQRATSGRWRRGFRRHHLR